MGHFYAIFFDDLAFSTIVFEFFTPLTGELEGRLGSGNLALDWLRLTRRTGDAGAGFLSGLLAGAAFIVTDFFTAIVIDFFGDSEILAPADF